MTQDYAISIESHTVKNFWPGRGQYKPVAIVEHMMHGTIETTRKYFNGEMGDYKVSAHYGVARDGRVWQFVREEDTAWANGIVNRPDPGLVWVQEALAKNTNLNAITLSIEYEGKSGESLTEAQYEAALALHQRLIERWNIPADELHIVGQLHLDSVDRAENPGSAFPWQRLLGDLNQSKPLFHSESFFEAPPETEPEPELEIPAFVSEPDIPGEPEPDSGIALEEGLPLNLDFPTIRPNDSLRVGGTSTEPEPLTEEQGGKNIIWSQVGGGVVKVELANVRVRPSYEPSTVLYQVSRGARMHFDGYSEGPELQGSTIWLHITRDDGYGWLHGALVQLDKAFNFPGK